MRQRINAEIVIAGAIVVAAVLLAGCGDDAAVDAADAPPATDPPSATDEPADEPADDEQADPAPEPAPAFATSIDDPAYVELVLDCWYGENEAGSCEQLEAAGLTADDAYGLGNSLSQTPDVFLREDCLAGMALSCAELNALVQATAAGEGAPDPRLLCLFWSAAREGVGDPVDFLHLDTLLGIDAPPGVLDGLERLEVDFSDAEAFEQASGYLDATCADFLG